MYSLLSTALYQQSNQMRTWALFSAFKRSLSSKEHTPQKRPYLLADTVALGAVFLAHKCACGVYIYDNGFDFAFSLSTDVAIAWGWLVLAHWARLPSCLSLTFCAFACSLVVFFVALCVLSTLSLMARQFAIRLRLNRGRCLSCFFLSWHLTFREVQHAP